ncbi:MAG TPA: M56 family metallopeptidase [Candidatus Acidoferrum sp.]|jgi:uncharacterized protein (TIGR03435 family)
MMLLTIAGFLPLSWSANASEMWAGIGTGLANHLWQSTLFAGVAGLLTLALGKNHARTRYWVWLAASVKFLIPFSLLVGMGSHLEWTKTSATPQSGFSFVVEQISQPFAPTNPAPVTAPVAPTRLEVAERVLPLVTWLLGGAGVLFFWWRRWRRMTEPIRGAVTAKSGREFEALRELERGAGITRHINLIVSNSALEPGILGIFRPALVLPAGISERLTDPQLSAIITHELCHVRRRDNLAAAVHMVVEAIFWFHPVVWWMGARLVDERERACDEEVLRLGSEPQVYAEGILKVCEFYLESPLFCAAGVTGSNLKKRIEAIMTHRGARNLELRKKVLLAVAAVLFVVGPVAFGALHAAKSRAASKPQNAASRTFAFADVMVKPNTTDTPMAGFDIKGKPFSATMFKPDRFMATNVTLHELLRLAYGVQDSQILGGPDWINSEKYDVNATVDGPSADELKKLGVDEGSLERKRMIQTMLAERFRLALHRETKELPVYVLLLGKNGPKLSPAKPGDTYASGPKGPDGSPIGPGYWQSEKGGIVIQGRPLGSSLVPFLSDRLDRIVLDQTGLNGSYDFKLRWAPDPPEASAPSVMSAVEDQLGLKLELQDSPVEVLVIDHAEQVAGGGVTEIQSGASPPATLALESVSITPKGPSGMEVPTRERKVERNGATEFTWTNAFLGLLIWEAYDVHPSQVSGGLLGSTQRSMTSA